MLLIAALAAAASVAAAEPQSRALTPEAPKASLTGLTPQALQSRLGEPDVANGGGTGALWTYRLPGCALLVFFEDKGDGLKVAGAEPRPLKRGDEPPTLEACLKKAPES